MCLLPILITARAEQRRRWSLFGLFRLLYGVSFRSVSAERRQTQRPLPTVEEPVRCLWPVRIAACAGRIAAASDAALCERRFPRPRRLATLLIESQFSKWRAVGMFNSGGLAGAAFIFHHVFYRQCSYHGNW